MKKLLLNFLLIIFFSLAAGAQEKDADTLVRKIFTAIKKQDEKAFIALFPNYIQMRNLIKQYLSTELENASLGNQKDSVLNEVLSKFTEASFEKDVKKEFAESFHKISQQGKEKGVNWSKATLENYSFNKIPTINNNIPNLMGVLFVKDGERFFEIQFDQVVWSEEGKGWFGVSLKNLTEKGENVEEDTLDIDYPEEELLIIDSPGVYNTTAIHDSITITPIEEKVNTNSKIKKKSTKKSSATKQKSPAIKPKNN